METSSIEQEVVRVLLRVGIRNGGYEYFKHIFMTILNENITFFNITEVYNRTAIKFHKTFACVEHAMRTSIERAYNYRTIFNLNDLIGQPVLYEKPSISGFVSIVIEYLRVFRGCTASASSL